MRKPSGRLQMAYDTIIILEAQQQAVRDVIIMGAKAPSLSNDGKTVSMPVEQYEKLIKEVNK